MQYAEILVDAKTERGTFHYSIPPQLLASVRRGGLVRVPFRTREIDGIVIDLSRRLPKGLSKEKVKNLSRVIGSDSLLPEELFLLSTWMTGYYLCSLADAIFTVLPPFPQRSRLSLLQRKGRSELARQGRFRRRVWEGKTVGFASQIYSVSGREINRWKRYISGIEKVIGRGEQVVAVFPDRDRAVRFLGSAKKTIGARTVFYSADLPRAARFRTWQHMRAGDYDLVVGTRLAVFSPAPRIGLLIIDDDAHPGHKEEQHPRYHTREVAVRRSELEGIPLLLGSLLPTVSTDSIPALHRIKLPRSIIPTVIVDTKRDRSLLSATVETAIEKSGRSIIFTTRLGAGAATRCQDCHHLFRCPNCTLPLTLHEGKELRCHHCGYSESLPATCPNCHGTNIRSVGLGTEGLETYLANRFPGRKIGRLEANRPVTREWDLLVATVKVLDTTFSAPVVVASSLDTILELPDPFAVERATRLLIELRDRATEQFFVQTRLPDHRAFGVLENEEEFLAGELARRRSQGYPPAVTLVRFLYQGPDQLKVASKLSDLAKKLREILPPNEVTVLGPGPCVYDRLKGKYRWHLLIKLLTENRKIRTTIKDLLPDDIQIDVNPIDIL